MKAQDWRIFIETDWMKVGFNQTVQSLSLLNVYPSFGFGIFSLKTDEGPMDKV